MSVRSLELITAYRALRIFRWESIPPLSIVTGMNGVGKTQLLEVVAANLGAHQLSGGWHAIVPPKVIFGTRPSSIGFLPSQWKHAPVAVSHALFEPIAELARWVKKGFDLRGDSLRSFDVADLDDWLKPVGERLLQKVRDGVVTQQASRASLMGELGPYDLVHPIADQPLVALAQVFYCYVNARMNAVLRGVSADEIDKIVGDSPWSVANELLREFEMGVRFVPPDDLRFPFELRCHDARSGAVLDPGELSSGEQAVLALVALVVTTPCLRPVGAPEPRDAGLLLLDEPDAHLNTSKVKSYLAHVQQLTERGVQIILVTHRPDTIALAPDGSLFELRQVSNRTEVVKVNSKAELIGRLAADTIAVLPGVRVVLVEAEPDRRFHQWAYDRALKLGLMPKLPRLVFLPVNAKGGGGKDAVIARLEVLRREGLSAVHRGLVDRDHDQHPEPRGVVRLGRYALENYLADPIAFYCAITNSTSADDKHRLRESVGIQRGDLGAIRQTGSAVLRSIADLVIAELEKVPALADRERVPITLHGEAGRIELTYPRWLLEESKASLRDAFNRVFGPAAVSSELLNGGPELSGLVPEDLVAAYRKLASSDEANSPSS